MNDTTTCPNPSLCPAGHQPHAHRADLLVFDPLAKPAPHPGGDPWAHWASPLADDDLAAIEENFRDWEAEGAPGPWDQGLARVAELGQPGRWEMPAPPDHPVWTAQGHRADPCPDHLRCWVLDPGTALSHYQWPDLLTLGGPLSATPPETAGGGQA